MADSKNSIVCIAAPCGEKIIDKNKSFFEEHKNHLLLVAGLVAGYLLYKKFKK